MRGWAIGLLLCVACVGAPVVGWTATQEHSLTLMLDFFPNPNHVPLYVAQEMGLLAERGIQMNIVVPSSPSDPLKLAAARTVDIGLSPQMNYLIARGQGLPLIAIAALIDQPLGGLLALETSGVSELADLRGRTVGYSLTPLEPVLWTTMLRSVDVEPRDFTLVNVGFNTVPSLLSGKTQAIGAFRNFEAIQLETLGQPARFFPEEEYGVPFTYDIILVTHPHTVKQRSEDLRKLVAALAEAIEWTVRHPKQAMDCFFQAFPDLDDPLNRRSLDATVPLYASGARHDDPGLWQTVQQYLEDNSLMSHTYPATDLFTADCLPRPKEK